MSVKSILIIGFGSAGKRFARILAAKGFRIYIFKHRKFPLPKKYFPQNTLDNLGLFYCIFIASPTSLHAYYLDKVAYSNIPVFIEKPITDNFSEAKRVVDTARRRKIKLQVGFNLRYLPIVKIIDKYIDRGKLGKILYANLYAGQYLPQWREDKKYDDTYSSSFSLGGGVSLDLIHEIDLANRWIGNTRRWQVYSSKVSSLKIDTEDFVQFFSKSNPPVVITLDYINLIKTRRYILVGEKASIECDIVAGRLIYNDKNNFSKLIEKPGFFDTEATYEAEISDFLNKIKKNINFDLSDRCLGIDSLAIALKGRKHVRR